ncbi:cell cycle control protein 50A [Scaptodrosophila lebanonensis]|uniref:Cell cycle control protein 50A n=1 Tax=Drosophila lebanonensis TaxID=7225 RepID=A0A6J2TSV8_DROLE|nr:cell cycle control protein 50A [Scaptodrosophila lebanonensis]XP_030378238.1 cell cycle control protein 50A [Scaptodrosophila lebanonensis]
MATQNTENEETTARHKSKRPSDSAFKQQRLPAWQPVLTARTVLPTFFIIGILFIPIGVVLLHFSNSANELIIDYTKCQDNSTGKTCASILEADIDSTCKCKINFTLEHDFNGDVYMYYGLTNYYQNHRRYVKSRDDDQLLGRLSLTPSTDCAPFAMDNDKPIAPCGAIANSLFNDTLKLTQNGAEISMFNTGIAWPSDKRVKFRNPEKLQEALTGFAKPKFWKKELYQLDLTNENNNGFQNEDFIVWMRTAALPSFRKLYRRLNRTDTKYTSGLKAGNYELIVDYNYPVMSFDGTKRMIISTTSVLGGKNPFLGIAYIVVGAICVTLGLVLLFIHMRCSRSSNMEMINVNPHTQYS